MLELLILYSLSKTELTLYGLRKYILNHFDEFSAPSHGSLHPALKKLVNKKLISVRKKISDGGKQYSFYSVSPQIKDYFNEKYVDINSSKSQALESFLLDIKIRILVSDIVDGQTLSSFKEKSLLKLDFYKDKVLSKLNNSYIEKNEAQKKLLNLCISQIDYYIDILKAMI